MDDFRKSDPNYTGFVPKTASEAIDLFTRHKNLGVPVSQWPETFVLVSKALPEDELDRFREWLVNPQGVHMVGLEYSPNPEIEKERKQLVKEADERDRMEIDEEEEEEKETFSSLLAECSLEC